jgi:hypothetical protein
LLPPSSKCIKNNIPLGLKYMRKKTEGEEKRGAYSADCPA